MWNYRLAERWKSSNNVALDVTAEIMAAGYIFEPCKCQFYTPQSYICYYRKLMTGQKGALLMLQLF